MIQKYYLVKIINHPGYPYYGYVLISRDGINWVMGCRVRSREPQLIGECDLWNWNFRCYSAEEIFRDRTPYLLKDRFRDAFYAKDVAYIGSPSIPGCSSEMEILRRLMKTAYQQALISGHIPH